MATLLRSFRLSTYITLAVACITLGYSEGSLLPESPYITGAVIVLLVVGYQLEGRWSLSLKAANIVGAGLIIILVGWISYQFVRKPSDLAIALPFPAFLLPYLGPVLMILIPAKLFRPKHIGDYWTMQGIGVLAVALACAMASNDLFFYLLMIVYLVCFAWSLALFHLYRVARPPEEMTRSSARHWAYLFRPAARWSILIGASGMMLFWITPRPFENKWELPMVVRGKMETGLSDSNLDLNSTGSLEQKNDLAFEVEAWTYHGEPKLDLDLNQRWRSSALVVYENGRWLRTPEIDRGLGATILDRARANPSGRVVEKDRVLDLGPTSYSMSFTLYRPTAGMNIVASPVLWRANEPPPIQVYGQRAASVNQRHDGTFEWVPPPSINRASHLQIAAPSQEPDLGPPMRLTGSAARLSRLPEGAATERLRRWTKDLLARLVQQEQLPPSALTEIEPFTGLPTVRHHEAIARALEQYLSTSNEFRYSTTLERRDRNIDPVEDFLYNTKSGHCQRFASALALMLRSQGIPAQLVLGHRGCESHGNGKYSVRQYHAHAWVEMLIVRSPPARVVPLRPDDLPPTPGSSAYHWLSLDPTPGGQPATEEESGFTNLFEKTRADVENFIKNFIFGYDAMARQRALDSVLDGLEDMKDDLLEGKITWPIAIVGGTLIVIPAWIIFRRRRRRRHAARATELATGDLAILTPFHGRLLTLLARIGLTQTPGQTAREFTAQAALELTKHATTADVANIPTQIAEAYYQVRFGDRSLSADELGILDTALQRLETALKTAPFAKVTHP